MINAWVNKLQRGFIHGAHVKIVDKDEKVYYAVTPCCNECNNLSTLKQLKPKYAITICDDISSVGYLTTQATTMGRSRSRLPRSRKGWQAAFNEHDVRTLTHEDAGFQNDDPDGILWKIVEGFNEPEHVPVLLKLDHETGSVEKILKKLPTVLKYDTDTDTE